MATQHSRFRPQRRVGPPDPDRLGDWDVIRMLDELARSESEALAANGGPAPTTWTETDGAPVRTRAGLLRFHGRVERLPGAE